MVLATILSVLPWRSDETNGAEALKAALAEPRKTVDLHGVFEEPRLDPTGANTAVFPVTLYDAETGVEYGSTVVEFEIEQSLGKKRLDNFLDAHGIENRSELDAIEGTTALVDRDYSGNIKVDW